MKRQTRAEKQEDKEKNRPARIKPLSTLPEKDTSAPGGLPGTAQPDKDLPPYATARAYEQLAIQRLQANAGNQSVQRFLAAHSTRGEAARATAEDTLQRDKEEGEAGKGAGETKKEAGGFDLGQWLSGEVYDLLKKELGEEKLKKHASDLAGKAVMLLMEQAKGAQSEADFLEKIKLDQMSILLTDELKRGIQELLATDTGKKIRQEILSRTKKDPGFALGMVLLALAAAVAANAEIPELSKEKELGAGFKAAGKASLGQFRDLALKQAQLGLSFTSKYFQASLTGSYTGEGEKEGFSGKAEASLGTKEIKFTSAISVNPDGTLNFNLVPALQLGKLDISSTIGYTPKGWTGAGQFKLGDKSNYLSPQVKVDENGQVSFGLGTKFTYDLLSFSTEFSTGKEKTTLSHGLNLTNLFGAEGFNVSASLAYRLGDDPAITGAGLKAGYKIYEPGKSSIIPVLMISLEGKYKRGEKGAPEDASGHLMIVGQF